MCEELLAGGVLPLTAAAIQSSSDEAQAKAAELVAELAKVGGCSHLVFCMCPELNIKVVY